MRTVLILLLALSVPVYSADEYGYFDGDGEVKAAWVVEANEKDRNVRLLEPFTYVDPSGRPWTAPAGAVVDGASIPPPLWNLWIGTPFVGNYRRASVVHDYECEVKTAESSHLVHRMFYDACLAGGVGEARARAMYWAVRNFGPKWGEQDAAKVLTKEQFKELIEMDAFFRSKGFNETTNKQEIDGAMEEYDLLLKQSKQTGAD